MKKEHYSLQMVQILDGYQEPVQPCQAIFVNKDVVTQSQHPDQQGYRHSRQTDAGVLQHVVT